MASNEIQQVEKLANRLSTYMSSKAVQDRDAEAHDRPLFIGGLHDACTIVRNIERGGGTPSDELIAKVDSVLNEAINFAYGDGDCFDFMPSFAHDDTDAPLVEDKAEGTGIFSKCQYNFKERLY